MTETLFKKALVCDDGKSAGDAALSVGRYLSEQLGTPIHVLHAVDIPSAEHVAGDPSEELERRRLFTQGAANWMEERVHGAVSPKCTTSLHLGKPTASVIKTAKEIEADLVVLGPHEKEFLDFGGTQRAIFAGTKCSIWSQPAPLSSIERIVCPCDLSPLSMAALDVARDLARALTIPLHVLSASEPPIFVEPTVMYGDVPTPTYVIESLHEAAEARFNEAMASVNFEDIPGATHEFLIGAPVPTILDMQTPTDLVVMGTRGHTGLTAAILGGTTYSVLKHAKGPVLAVRSAD